MWLVWGEISFNRTKNQRILLQKLIKKHKINFSKLERFHWANSFSEFKFVQLFGQWKCSYCMMCETPSRIYVPYYTERYLCFRFFVSFDTPGCCCRVNAPLLTSGALSAEQRRQSQHQHVSPFRTGTGGGTLHLRFLPAPSLNSLSLERPQNSSRGSTRRSKVKSTIKPQTQEAAEWGLIFARTTVEVRLIITLVRSV